jgi:predicted CxxxxCH...CXXCH cytochrome family protein
MIPETRFRRSLHVGFGWMIVAAMAVVAGCSTANTTGGGDVVVNHIDASGNSIAGWVAATGGTHANSATMNYIANGGSSSCTECHGSDLSGGTSRVSCFGNTAGCHHGSIAGWVAVSPAAQNHGISAKKAPGSSGFVSCRICHGSDFSGGGAKVSCFTCHGVSAPHPSRPWRAGAGSLYDHVTTDNANASVCYDCHAYTGTANPNNPHVPTSPASAGTAPGCYNGTMCHNQAGHPAGWAATSPAAQPHGDAAKKDGTVAGQGFPYCQSCHDANFTGGTANVSCFTCHGVNAPHSPKPWRGSPYSHTTTVEAGNVSVCYVCHAYTGSPNPRNPHVPPTPAPTGTAPGCYNGTMCHNSATAPHATGTAWTVAGTGFHGTDAKADLTYCQGCHGTPGTIDFNGGSASTACSTCHTAAKAHPTDWQGSRTINGVTISHRTSGNRTAACGICHNVAAAGAGPNPSAPSCFSASFTNASGQARTCHSGGPGQASHAVPFFDNTAHTQATTASFTSDCGNCHAVTGTSPVSGAPLCTSCHITDPRDVTNCTSCHANPPSGASTAYPNVGGAHSKHIALNGAGTPISCDTCHNGLGTGTLNHYNRAKTRLTPGDVAFLTTYNAKTGASSFDNSAALSCSNVSCHGGVATPSWQTGSITVTTQCTNCHVFGSSLGNPQYNSPYSGQHNINTSHRTCTNCHNTTTLAVNHFTTLGTTTMEGPASATIGGTGTTVTTYAAGSCTPSVGSGGGCHSTRSWQ